METHAQFCPECGSEETGFFCRNCGALVAGEDRVLCPRCHHIVPAGKYCNQCGQSVAGVALNLKQLALAGDTFWVTPAAPGAAEPSAAEPASADTLAAAPTRDVGLTLLTPPDESVELTRAELPDWLSELPPPVAASGPERRLYPRLGAIEEPPKPVSQRGFMIAVAALMLVLLVGLAVIILMLIART